MIFTHLPHADSYTYPLLSQPRTLFFPHCILISFISYPEWSHRPCVGLAFPRSRVRVPLAAASLVICDPYLHHAMRSAQGVLPCVEWGVTASQLDLPSLTLLSVACYGRLQLGAPHWATSVALLQIVNN